MRVLSGLGILFVLFPLTSIGQEMVQYTSDYRFKTGLYVSFDDFKNNNPIPITHVLSNYDIRDSDYLHQVLEHDSVVYFDNLYEERTKAVQDLWGFCEGGRIFIGFGADRSFDNPEFFDFFPLVNIGAVSLFTAVESFYRSLNTRPSMAVGFPDPMYDNRMTVTDSEQVQLLLDFRTGKILLAKRGNLGLVPIELVSQVIKSDSVLLHEYSTLSIKDQKQKGVFFIRRFNERNPIYFPVSNQ